MFTGPLRDTPLGSCGRFDSTFERENKPKSRLLLAPRAGFEPATQRLTAACSTTELPGNGRHIASGVALCKAAPWAAFPGRAQHKVVRCRPGIQNLVTAGPRIGAAAPCAAPC